VSARTEVTDAMVDAFARAYWGPEHVRLLASNPEHLRGAIGAALRAQEDLGVTEAMVVAATKASAAKKAAHGGSYSRMHAAITAALRAQEAGQ
jgi:hypothetical protein